MRKRALKIDPQTSMTRRTTRFCSRGRSSSEGSIHGLAEQNANEQLEDSTDSPRESSNDMEVDL
jgi:hypothetical protein